METYQTKSEWTDWVSFGGLVTLWILAILLIVWPLPPLIVQSHVSASFKVDEGLATNNLVLTNYNRPMGFNHLRSTDGISTNVLVWTNTYALQHDIALSYEEAEKMGIKIERYSGRTNFLTIENCRYLSIPGTALIPLTEEQWRIITNHWPEYVKSAPCLRFVD